MSDRQRGTAGRAASLEPIAVNFAIAAARTSAMLFRVTESRGSWLHTHWKAACIFLAVCAVVFVVGYVLITLWCAPDILVKPRRALNSDRARQRQMHAQLDRAGLVAQPFTAKTHDGLTLACLLVTPTNGLAGGTVVQLHGIHGVKEYELWTARELFAPTGLNLIVYDSRGHGASQGKFCTYGLKEAADVGAVVDAATAKFGSLGRIGLMGQSMGATVGLQALPREPRITCAVLVSPIASLEAASRSTVGHTVPLAGPFLFDSICDRAATAAEYHVREINTLGSAREVKVPALVVHGAQDWKVPVGQGREVFESLGSRKKEFYEVERAGHDNLWNERNAELRQKVRIFFSRHLADR